jgi:hypothetical protein
MKEDATSRAVRRSSVSEAGRILPTAIRKLESEHPGVMEACWTLSCFSRLLTFAPRDRSVDVFGNLGSKPSR